MIRVIGDVPISAVNPGALALSAALTASAVPSAANLSAQIAGLAEASLAITTNPPDVFAILDQALALVAAAQAAIANGFPAPNVQLAAIAAGIASLQAQLDTINASLALSAAMPLGATVQAAVYTGPSAYFGQEMGAYFNGGIQGGGPATDSVVLCIGATAAESRAAMGVVFGV